MEIDGAPLHRGAEFERHRSVAMHAMTDDERKRLLDRLISALDQSTLGPTFVGPSFQPGQTACP